MAGRQQEQCSSCPGASNNRLAASAIRPAYHTSALTGGLVAIHCGSSTFNTDQVRSIRIDYVQYELTAHNTDLLRISCDATAFRLWMLSRGGRLLIFEKFKTTAVPCRLLRLVGDYG